MPFAFEIADKCICAKIVQPSINGLFNGQVASAFGMTAHALSFPAAARSSSRYRGRWF
ncbi:hypothetical protein RHECNPAF_9300140 [Rhizobium etli CNPAF512]|nr:hypothetical protein RHECNPAF_9300140 [Rhizobium etli CNPAF512]